MLLLGLGSWYPEKMRRAPITTHAIGILSRRLRHDVDSLFLPARPRPKVRLNFPEIGLQKFSCKLSFSFYPTKRAHKTKKSETYTFHFRFWGPIKTALTTLRAKKAQQVFEATKAFFHGERGVDVMPLEL